MNQVVQRALKRLPLVERAANLLVRGRLPIFMLHRVLPAQESCYDPEMATSVELFEALLQWAREKYEITSTEELVERGTRAGGSRHPACAFTFDDGWRDNYLHAFPLLRKYQIPATIFVAVNFIGTEYRFWQDRLWTLLGQRDSAPVDRTVLKVVSAQFSWCPRLTPKEFNFAWLRRCLMHQASAEAERFVAALEELLGNSGTSRSRTFLNWEEVQEMQQAGIRFGSHTVHHTLLTRASTETARTEIEVSRDELKRRLGEAPSGFSYPWGSTTRQITQMVREIGYCYAVTTHDGLVSERHDPWLLPRVAISSPILGKWQGRFHPARMSLYLAASSVRGKRK